MPIQIFAIGLDCKGPEDRELWIAGKCYSSPSKRRLMAFLEDRMWVSCWVTGYYAYQLLGQPSLSCQSCGPESRQSLSVWGLRSRALDASEWSATSAAAVPTGSGDAPLVTRDMPAVVCHCCPGAQTASELVLNSTFSSVTLFTSTELITLERRGSLMKKFWVSSWGFILFCDRVLTGEAFQR